jgi:hypothetical protein
VAAGATYLVGKDLEMSNSGLDSLESRIPAATAAGASYLAGKESINRSGNSKFWPSQSGDFKKQHLLPRQQVSKNHIIDNPPCAKAKKIAKV